MGNRPHSIKAFELALQIFTKQHFPKDWAGPQNNLANAYNERVQGTRSENTEGAIAAYKLALEIDTRQNFPKNWAMTQNNLGEAYRDRIRESWGSWGAIALSGCFQPKTSSSSYNE